MRSLARAPLIGVLVGAASLGLALFSRGFFPVKPLVTGWTESRKYAAGSASSEPSDDAPFSRLVFVLVDALRSDFAFGPDSHMSFVSALVSSGRALPCTAIAQPPTVTLPRIKGLTTGSSPTFLDAILNIAEESAATAALENVDSWVRQLATGEEKRKLVFAGDDTWLRLFPARWFAWSEGVSSFFVSDTQTVDTNVTRHLDFLLDNSSAIIRPFTSAYPPEWDVLLLHYLGLDHVGHLGGPESPLMAPKQTEMDGIVQRLYEALEERDRSDGRRSLLVLAGDHGMTEGGNHGGSTEAETSAALLFAAPSHPPLTPTPPVTHSSPYKHHEVVQQVDLVPTLSVLNSMGKLIESVVERYRPSALRSGLIANVEQMVGVLHVSDPGAADELLCEVATKSHRACGDSKEELRNPGSASTFLRLAQERLLISFADYHLPYLMSGVFLLLLSSLGFLALSYPIWRTESLLVRRGVGAALVAYLGSFFATSFIEEEHEYWYFVTATALLVLALRPNYNLLDRLHLVASAASIRVLRSWAHNGAKDVPNLSISASLATNPFLSHSLLFFIYILISFIPLASLVSASRSYTRRTASPTQLLSKALAFGILATLVVLQAVVGAALRLKSDGAGEVGSTLLRALEAFELDDVRGLARVGYGLGGAAWVFARVVEQSARPDTKPSYETLRLAILSILLMSFTRTPNIPLFALFWIQHATLSRLSASLSPLELACLVFAFQSASFFGLGGSNSLATVDLSQAYNGVSSYSLSVVSLLTYFSNFSGAIFFAVSARMLSTSPSSPPSTASAHTLLATTFFGLALSTLAASAVHFRYHLFAFTVFSPAVLYKIVWWAFVHLGTNLGLARVLA
ncbi:hypothetical protein JCM21900_002023 [Sporobolomyces salmonicolor]